MKTFCIAGPVNPEEHYFIAHRMDKKNHIFALIEQKKYFILHAPRQSGKTTSIKELVHDLNAQGMYKALYVNVEPAQASRSRVIEGLLTILDQLKSNITITFGSDDPGMAYFKDRLTAATITGNELYNFFEFWSRVSDKPTIFFIDEIDSLVGDTLISVLRQIRAGYPNRPVHFPQSICLVGVRDVRDYRIWSDLAQQSILGGSAFNIKAESLTLLPFSVQEVRDLYMQHTASTGQQFTQDAIDHAFYLTQGQPWLVNALAYQACFRDVTDRAIAITRETVEKAKEVLIARQDTHIDVLIDRLKEERVKNIVQALLLGTQGPIDFPSDDILYAQDLGIISRLDKGLKIANPIYQEILPRALVESTQRTIDQQSAWYVRADGSLDMEKLLVAFTQFFRENIDAWSQKFDYKKAGPHLLLMAFLQRIINGGGTLHREYALGRGRVDLLVTWKQQRIVLELKLWRDARTVENGIKQTVEYMDAHNATEGHLIIFDRSTKKPWSKKIYRRSKQYGDSMVNMWGM